MSTHVHYKYMRADLELSITSHYIAIKEGLSYRVKTIALHSITSVSLEGAPPELHIRTVESTTERYQLGSENEAARHVLVRLLNQSGLTPASPSDDTEPSE